MKAITVAHEGRTWEVRLDRLDAVAPGFIVVNGVQIEMPEEAIKKLQSMLDKGGRTSDRRLAEKKEPARRKSPASAEDVQRLCPQQLKAVRSEIAKLAEAVGFMSEPSKVRQDLIEKHIVNPLLNRLNVGARFSTPERRTESIEGIRAVDFEKTLEWLGDPKLKRRLLEIERNRQKVLKTAASKWTPIPELVKTTRLTVAHLKPVLQDLVEQGLMEKKELENQRGKPLVFHAVN